MKIEEAAVYCRVSKKTLYNHIWLGNLKPLLGLRHRRLFHRDELDRWLTSKNNVSEKKPRNRACARPTLALKCGEVISFNKGEFDGTANQTPPHTRGRPAGRL